MINLASYMTLKEVAILLDVHIETVRRAVQQGKLQALQMGRGYRVSPEALEAYIRGQYTRKEKKC